MAKTVEELQAQIDTLENEKAALKTENDTLKNKETGVEAERAKNKELKEKIATLETEITNLWVKLEEAKTNWANNADGFKVLYEEKKAEVIKLTGELEAANWGIEELKTLKDAQEAKLTEDINVLFESVPEDQQALVKDMASKYPIEERVSFITNFTKQFVKKSKKQGGGPNWDNWEGKTGMERAQELYDELKNTQIKTQAQKKQFLKLGKILAGEIKIDD